MGAVRKAESLNKFLAYVLGRRPDEFGLIPDALGWVKIRDLLRAMAEEEGWKHVRKGHLNEVTLSVGSPSIIIEDDKIRAVELDPAFDAGYAEDPPKLLYVGIRQRTYPVMHDRGIFPVGFKDVILCRDREMAVRIGKRLDPSPVVLTVNTAMASDKGVVFFQKGELLYVSDEIPPGCFTGPPLPPPKPEAPKKPKPEKDPAESMGTFALDLGHEPSMPPKGGKPGKGKQKRSWKEDARRARRKGRR